MDTILTKDAFIDWLQSKEPDDRVGRTMDPLSCPIACYLHEKTGNGYEVGSKCWYALYDRNYNHSVDNRLPVWAQDFIRSADSLSEQSRSPITATQALSLLKEIL